MLRIGSEDLRPSVKFVEQARHGQEHIRVMRGVGLRTPPGNAPEDAADRPGAVIIVKVAIAALDIVHRQPFETEVEDRSEEHTSELQSLMRISYAVFCLKKKKKTSINY